ncbi:uncharacterized protein CEXT_242421 [Caerostris extrusa]|uniref:BHLH domain-containing protein n=1 Tax=Caerostris extrusa TaxID=172846 RepID=A0AAV4NHB7_CAEEX|nr:uncharacterized protein CEXT_242421 [Caerostris extrusa]
MSGCQRSGQGEIRVAFIELFDLGGRFDARRKSRENNEERRDSGASANVGLIDGRTGRKHRQKDAACRKRLQVVNNFLERPRGGRPSPTICHCKFVFVCKLC